MLKAGLVTASAAGAYGAADFADWLELQQIISQRRIRPVFQPIVSLDDGAVYGYESLSRIVDPGTIANPEQLFDNAQRFGMSVQVERLCREKALFMADELGLDGLLFLNVCPALLLASSHQRGFTAELLDALGMERSRVVFELTEKSVINDYGLLEKGVNHYRSQGYSIAIDDLGDGYAGLKMLSQITPDYVKLARFLVCDIDRNPVRQALVESITCFCKRMGIKVIAEGIETTEELAYLTGINVDFAQGYLLARPTPQPPSQGEFVMPSYVAVPPGEDNKRLCSNLNRRRNN